MMNYQQQIKHPLWQKKRLEVLELHNFQCQECRTKEDELHVHHPFYKRGAMIWEYEKKELECLCFRCHKDRHEIDEKIKKALAVCPKKQDVLNYILSINGEPKKTRRKKKPTYTLATAEERFLSRLEEEEAEDARKTETFYSEHPDLRPCEDDTSDQAADKFFARMRLMLGD